MHIPLILISPLTRGAKRMNDKKQLSGSGEVHATPKNVWFQAGPVWGGFVIALSLCWYLATTLTRLEGKSDTQSKQVEALTVQLKEQAEVSMEQVKELKLWAEKRFDEADSRLDELKERLNGYEKAK